MFLEKLAPKKFLCRLPLDLGSLVAGIFMCLIMLGVIIASIFQVFSMENYKFDSHAMWRDAYSFTITSIIYAIIMLFINIWFIWGVLKRKKTVVLSWVVITFMWLLQVACMLLVLIILYSTQVALAAWVLALVFGLIAIGILVYFLLVGYGYWLELKGLTDDT